MPKRKTHELKDGDKRTMETLLKARRKERARLYGLNRHTFPPNHRIHMAQPGYDFRIKQKLKRYNRKWTRRAQAEAIDSEMHNRKMDGDKAIRKTIMKYL